MHLLVQGCLIETDYLQCQALFYNSWKFTVISLRLLTKSPNTERGDFAPGTQVALRCFFWPHPHSCQLPLCRIMWIELLRTLGTTKPRAEKGVWRSKKKHWTVGTQLPLKRSPWWNSWERGMSWLIRHKYNMFPGVQHEGIVLWTVITPAALTG